MAEASEDNAAKIIHAAKKGLTEEVLRLMRKDEASCAAAHDKVNHFHHKIKVTDRFCIIVIVSLNAV